jgi:type IV secretion system protein TrbI
VPLDAGPATGGAGEGGGPARRAADAAGGAGEGAGGGTEAGIGVGAGGGTGAGAGSTAPGGPRGSRWEALAGHPATGGEPLAVRYRAPAAAGTVAAGTLISATLLTAVDSGLPGPLLAQVSRDVYDGALRRVVIPRGTRLLGRYQDQVAAGQNRLLVAWTRFLFADGGSIEVAGLPAADATGAAGLPARSDNHLRRVFGDAVLLSLLGAGAQLSQPAASGFATAPSTQQVAAAALGQELSSVGLELVRRDLAVQPTLRVPAGTPFFVFVTADLPGVPRPAPVATSQPGTTRRTAGSPTQEGPP